ncbi:phosphate regulon sensor histidine kinase PhoR [Aestuariibacter sp. AA17]|uniref:histidine kinase n=1 Tax=Fluctibacter corallii TaxID=2984329 RepID=A0ABT3A8B9_9ALTE|nr:phosphate regulon sensor histidine kinase PhoR [Aestuariibacter sp. AA17]MCV2884837.1 phosphate regulon sensor histidine kinase PhoR [Aestuariibacter sp. AA17]
MYNPFSWLRSVLRITLFFVVVIIIGLIVDRLILAVALGAMWLLAVQFWQMYRLNQWLWRSKRMTPPRSKGFWEHIYEGVYYLQRRHRRKRKELSKIVKRFREGAEALPDAAVVVDSESAIVWCNRLARIELGLRWPQDAGRRIDNLIRHPKFIEYFNSDQYSQPIEVPSPTNVQKTFEYRIKPYGEQHLLIMARDVTRLTQLEQTRKDFVANVSHELRTPLTVLNGYLEMLQVSEQVPPELFSKAMTEMSIQSVRMQGLVEQLLILSRIEASSERVFENRVDVPQMLAIIETEALTLNQEKHHTIEFDVDSDLRVYGSDTELRSAFSNLIFNAIHYTPDGGNIRVSWQRQGHRAKFCVADNGDGIAAKHINRLTERFYRVDKARSRKTGGSGLGLAIVKHVLSHHNSKLEIKSQVGKGSEFFFYFSEELCIDKNHPEDEDMHLQ